MNKEEPYRDHAERLKQRIQKINEKVDENDHLPRREEVHRQRKKKTKWKLKYPVIRLLVLCFILLPIIIFSVISYRDGGGKKINGTEKTSGNTKGFETINLEKPKKGEAENTDKSEEVKEINQENKDLSDSDEKSLVSNVAQPAAGENSTVTNQPSSSDVATSKGQESDRNVKPQGETVKSQTTTTTSKIIHHTVQPKETLFSLAIKYYHSQKGMNIIMKANNLTSDQLKVGQVLKIPLSN